jgi:6-phosphofructokinase 1
MSPPDFTIPRLGPAKIPSPLAQSYDAAEARFFVPEDARTLLDTTGLSWEHGQMPSEIEPGNLEVAGPRSMIFFKPEETRAAIVTCGGLCPGLNNVIRALTRQLLTQYRIWDVVGIRYGFAGLVEGGAEPVQLSPTVVERIHEQGGTFLGSSRGPQPVAAMVDFLAKRKIDILFTIGGDGTQRGALEICREVEQRKLKIAVVGLPKTIDNDLGFVEKTFGFETAFSLADQALRAAHAEATGAFNGVGLVKLMGRHSGYIATLAALANGDVNYVLIPEVRFELHGANGLLNLLEGRLQQRQHAVVVVAEGAGQDLMREEVKKAGVDASGNQRLADIGAHLRREIEKHFKAKEMPVNVRYIDPSYMIRSAPATPNDAVFCLQLAQNAAHAAMSGRTAMLVGLWNTVFTHVPLAAIADQKKRVDPAGPLWLTLLQAIEQPESMVNA